MALLRVLSGILANILIPLAALIFATGFFPYKPVLPGLATFAAEDAREELDMLKELDRPARVFDKVVFMVVDALRRSVIIFFGSDGLRKFETAL